MRPFIGEPREERNGGARDELPHEHDAAPRLATGRGAADVQAQVHLVESTVARDRRAEHACVEEAEADDAHEGAALPEIERGTGGGAGGWRRLGRPPFMHNCRMRTARA